MIDLSHISPWYFAGAGALIIVMAVINWVRNKPGNQECITTGDNSTATNLDPQGIGRTQIASSTGVNSPATNIRG